VKQTTGFYPRLIVDTATSPAVGQAGGVLLTETITLTGLGRELATALAPWRRQQWRSAAADGRAPRCGRYQAEPFGIAVTAPALHLPEGAACGRAESDGHVPGPRVVNPGSAPATAIPVR